MDAADVQSPRAARMFEAMQGLERRLGRRVTLDELGVWVAEREGRGAKPYAGSVVRRWLRDLSEPRSTTTWYALAAVLEVDPGWLVFGSPRPGSTEREERFRSTLKTAKNEKAARAAKQGGQARKRGA